MLKRINPLLIALLLVSLVVIVVQAVSPYGSYQEQWKPERGQDANYSQQTSNQTPVTNTSIQIECDPNCAAKKAEEHRDENWIMRFVRKSFDDPLALFTGVLALATMFLALYTAIVAGATKKAAEHIPRVERAYLFIEPSLEKSRAIDWYTNHGATQNDLWVSYSFFNYGKTPAVVESFEIHFEMWTDEPDNRRHLPNTLINVHNIVAPSARWGKRSMSLPRDLSIVEFNAVQDGHAYLWLYGSIQYRDIFDEVRTTSFRWRGGGILNVFTAYGAAPYNQRT